MGSIPVRGTMENAFEKIKAIMDWRMEHISKWAEKPIHACDVCKKSFNQIILIFDGANNWSVCSTCRHTDDFLIEIAYKKLMNTRSRSSIE